MERCDYKNDIQSLRLDEITKEWVCRLIKKNIDLTQKLLKDQQDEEGFIRAGFINLKFISTTLLNSFAKSIIEECKSWC